MSETLLKVKGLKVAYGGIQAVKGVDFEVREGELVSLIGSNGAGKTTTMKAITGLLAMNDGDIEYLGQSIRGRGAWDLALRWRHLPDAIDGEQVVSPTATQRGAEEAYDVFDLTGSWNATDNTTLRFGVENLLDEPPVWTGRRVVGDPSPSSGSLTTEARFYDILGRQFFIGVSSNF